MALTWKEFLELAKIITNLDNAIYYFDDQSQFDHKKIEFELKNRRVAVAAINYKEFFNDTKYVRFMNEVRISFTKIL